MVTVNDYRWRDANDWRRRNPVWHQCDAMIHALHCPEVVRYAHDPRYAQHWFLYQSIAEAEADIGALAFAHQFPSCLEGQGRVYHQPAAPEL